MCIRDRHRSKCGYRPDVSILCQCRHRVCRYGRWLSSANPMGCGFAPARARSENRKSGQAAWHVPYPRPVSYTHLDVYKRQIRGRAEIRHPADIPQQSDAAGAGQFFPDFGQLRQVFQRQHIIGLSLIHICFRVMQKYLYKQLVCNLAKIVLKKTPR